MRLLIAGGVAAIALAADPAFAQRYPEKPIRFIAPYAPGGSTDLLTRTLAQKLTESLGQTVVPDNRPGAGGNVGADIAAKSAPDGYTILLAPVSPMAINVTLYGKKLPFNPERDFAPITLVAKVPLVIVVNLNVPAKTLQEFIALAKARPGKLTYGSSGNGSSNHMTGAMLMSAAQLDMVHVPYKGGGPGMVALLGGDARHTDDDRGGTAGFRSDVVVLRGRARRHAEADRRPAERGNRQSAQHTGNAPAARRRRRRSRIVDAGRTRALRARGNNQVGESRQGFGSAN